MTTMISAQIVTMPIVPDVVPRLTARDGCCHAGRRTYVANSAAVASNHFMLSAISGTELVQ